MIHCNWAGLVSWWVGQGRSGPTVGYDRVCVCVCVSLDVFVCLFVCLLGIYLFYFLALAGYDLRWPSRIITRVSILLHTHTHTNYTHTNYTPIYTPTHNIQYNSALHGLFVGVHGVFAKLKKQGPIYLITSPTLHCHQGQWVPSLMQIFSPRLSLSLSLYPSLSVLSHLFSRRIPSNLR